MRIICAESEREAGNIAAKIIADVIRESPTALLGLATGSTPIPTYEELVKMYCDGLLSFKGVSSVNLDEYVGLPPTNEQSYSYFMEKNLFSQIDIQSENVHIPNGISHNPSEECINYDRLLARLGRVDIQLLGIGHNGHIAFNEPDSHFPKDTSLVSLSSSTVEANSRFFSSPDQVPKSAISMGIGPILRAKRILLLATGVSKADVLEKALFGSVTPSVPASILQFYQGELTVVGDTAALSVVIEKHPEAVES